MRAVMAVALAVVLASPALACQVGSATTGSLGTQPSGNSYGGSLGSVAAVLTVTNIPVVNPAYHVTVAAPVLSAWASAFNAAGATVQVSYTAVGTGVAVTQDYTSSATGFDAPSAAAAVAMVIQSRIVSSSGFTGGNYQTQVTVTCG